MCNKSRRERVRRLNNWVRTDTYIYISIALLALCSSLYPLEFVQVRFPRHIGRVCVCVCVCACAGGDACGSPDWLGVSKAGETERTCLCVARFRGPLAGGAEWLEPAEWWFYRREHKPPRPAL